MNVHGRGGCRSFPFVSAQTGDPGGVGRPSSPTDYPSVRRPQVTGLGTPESSDGSGVLLSEICVKILVFECQITLIW